MPSRGIVNASPLIYLSRAGMLDLLTLASPRVLVPASVWNEISRRGDQDPCVAACRARSWIEPAVDPPIPPSVLAWDLGAGESAVVALALATSDAVAIVDDLLGRRCAEAHGVKLRGTLGLVLAAKRCSSIPSAREALDKLKLAGMYLSPRTREAVLAEVGER